MVLEKTLESPLDGKEILSDILGYPLCHRICHCPGQPGPICTGLLALFPVFKHGDWRRVDPEYTVALISPGEEKIKDPSCCLDVPLSHLA